VFDYSLEFVTKKGGFIRKKELRPIFGQHGLVNYRPEVINASGQHGFALTTNTTSHRVTLKLQSGQLSTMNYYTKAETNSKLKVLLYIQRTKTLSK